LPAWLWALAVDGLAHAMSSDSPNMSLWAAASALYGTWTSRAPVWRISSSPNRWAEEPLPQVP
jgi:hypothetical protein